MKGLLTSFGILALVLIAAATVSGCASSGTNTSTDTGILKGRVTVGPLTPVERVDVTPPPPDPAVFTSRKLLLYDASGKTLLREIPIEPPPPGGYQGSYNVTLKPGDYRLGYDYMGGVRFIPPVSVEAGKTSVVDVFIDTGIR